VDNREIHSVSARDCSWVTSPDLSAVKRFRDFIEAPIRADNDSPAWKDPAIFHYQPRGD
jgi:hypothetical protein